MDTWRTRWNKNFLLQFICVKRLKNKSRLFWLKHSQHSLLLFSHSVMSDSATLWTAALDGFTSTDLVMPSNHLICWTWDPSSLPSFPRWQLAASGCVSSGCGGGEGEEGRCSLGLRWFCSHGLSCLLRSRMSLLVSTPVSCDPWTVLLCSALRSSHIWRQFPCSSWPCWLTCSLWLWTRSAP